MAFKNKDIVYDKTFNVIGTVMDDEDPHNIYVEYEDDGGTGLYCTVKNCDDYDKDLVIK